VIVLDTHVLVWWVSGDERLSATARQAIEAELAEEQGQLLVSTITAWEVAMLVDRGRLVLTMDVDDWLDTAASIEGLWFEPVSRQQAVQSVRLPGEFHPDPADRLITALARHQAVPLVTADRKIRDYPHVKTIW
jgi:PIN domain nuclease of toxin-antitoxin system